MKRKHICIVTSSYNEEGNITEFYKRIKCIMAEMPQYTYDIICIDNCSEDKTREELRNICSRDKNFKAIFNTRNFGVVRSSAYVFYQAKGDAVISIASDLEDPPELIPIFLKNWEDGAKLVLAQYRETKDSFLFLFCRRFYYKILNILSLTSQIKNVTGFGLYDKEVVKTIKHIKDPYPYLRGLLCELGYKANLVPFSRDKRPRGLSSYSFYEYFNMALLGLVKQSFFMIKFSIFLGLIASFIGTGIGVYFVIKKIIFGQTISVANELIVAMFLFLFGMSFLFVGFLGEYLKVLLQQISKVPIVVEEERINF